MTLEKKPILFKMIFILGEAMDVARFAERGAHYPADAINLLP